MTTKQLEILIRLTKINSDKMKQGLTAYFIHGETKSNAAREVDVTRAAIGAAVKRISETQDLVKQYALVG